MQNFTHILTRTHILSLILLVIVSFFASRKLLINQFYTSHDGEGHVIRMEEFHESLMDGQFPVRIAKRINYGLGYPFFNFNYPLVYYSAEVFHLSGLSVVSSFKALLIVSLVVGGIGMYAFSSLFFTRLASLFAGILYIIAPYRFLNMYVRGNVAEQLGLALLPVVLLVTERTIRKKNSSRIPLALILALFILSHNITALIGMVLVSAYAIIRVYTLKLSSKRNTAIRLVSSLGIALLLTAFFWIPVVVEGHLTKLSELQTDYKDFFPTFREIIYSPWGFGPWKLGEFPGKMSPQIGIVHVLVGVVSFFMFITNRFRRKKREEFDDIVLFFLGICLVSIFLSTSYSRFLWDHSTLLARVQIPWRFVGFIIVGISLVSAYSIDQIKNRMFKNVVLIGCIFLLIYANRNHIRVNQFVTYTSPFTTQEVIAMSTTSKDEHMPKLAPRIYEVPNPQGDIFPPVAGTSVRTDWRSNYHAFNLDMETNGEFRDNTSYYPGWVGILDGKETKILYATDELYRLRVTVPKGTHQVEFIFVEPWYRAFADSVSIITLASLSIVVIWKRKNYFSSV